jgi:hypothetical protein
MKSPSKAMPTAMAEKRRENVEDVDDVEQNLCASKLEDEKLRL